MTELYLIKRFFAYVLTQNIIKVDFNILNVCTNFRPKFVKKLFTSI